jgi:hypothetical protein
MFDFVIILIIDFFANSCCLAKSQNFAKLQWNMKKHWSNDCN